jgi:DNA-binding GntR family transcriptional regulator
MSPHPKTSRPKQPLAALAYDKIYRKILTLEYEPGRRLEEKVLMADLGIGRTPIREALQRLADDFMVESQHTKGFLVRPITLQSIKSAFAALKILELGVASLAVRQDAADYTKRMAEANLVVKRAIDDKDTLLLVESNKLFHQYLAQCSRNDYLIHALHKVRCETNRLAYLSFGHEIDPFRSLQDHYNSVVIQHDQIIRSIENRQEKELKDLISEHIEAFQSRIVWYMSA